VRLGSAWKVVRISPNRYSLVTVSAASTIQIAEPNDESPLSAWYGFSGPANPAGSEVSPCSAAKPMPVAATSAVHQSGDLMVVSLMASARIAPTALEPSTGAPAGGAPAAAGAVTPRPRRPRRSGIALPRQSVP